MSSRVIPEREETIFKKGRGKGEERWYVKVSCNFFKPRVYGPFPDKLEASRFREGAEFELRKLLDCELPARSEGFRLSAPHMG